MSIYFFLFFLLSLSTAQDDCTSTTSKCSDDGPPIRFPFRLKNQHPPHCGYPGFDLSCSPNNTSTVLDLPNSVKVIVTHIDYKSRLIHIKDLNGCFPQQLQNLNLSTTPFKFADVEVRNIGFFSCPPPTKMEGLFWSTDTIQENSYRVTCLGRDVYFQYSHSIRYAPMISCRKMYNVWSVPLEAFDQTADLQFKWLQPDCGKCETDGKFCRLMSNSTSEEILCFGNLNPPKKGHDLEIAGVTLGSFLLLVILIAMHWFHRQEKIKRKDCLKIEMFLEDYRALKPARYSYDDIKKITNQLKDKIGQGGYGTVYRGQLSNDVHVAVKILNNTKGNGEEFINEVGIIGTVGWWLLI